MRLHKTFTLAAALCFATAGIALADSTGSVAPPTRHQIHHGMKPGHHGSPATAKHRRS